MSFTDALLMFSGIGLLLYGMKMMSGGLEAVAGDSLQIILKKATSNRFLAVLVGIVATIVINSSTASTIIAVGFVNSGFLNLTQAIGIIMGANVGTTFSAQVIALLGGDGLSLRDISAAFIGLGAVMYVFFKNPKVKNIGFVVLGFGILFLGVTTMSNAVRPLRDHQGFQDFLVGFENPVLALLAGFVVTAIIQSSTATTAILVTLLASGVFIPFQTSAFILLGVNIGTSLTTVISSIPANRESKRAAIFHIMYDIIGSIIFGTLILVFPGILTWFTTTWSHPAQQAAMFHTLYNVSTVILLLPFIKYIAALMQKIVPAAAEKTSVTHEKKLMYLFGNKTKMSSSLLVMNAHSEICRMWKIASENLNLALESFFEKDADKANAVFENEKTIDFLHQSITPQLASITNMHLSTRDAKKIGDMFVAVSDIEQIGDHAENIAEYTLAVIDNNRKFSDDAINELKELSKLTTELINNSLTAYEKQNKSKIPQINELEYSVSELSATSARNHFRRLKAKNCKPKSGIIFMDIVNDLKKSAGNALSILSR